jgi:hypothetical protein
MQGAIFLGPQTEPEKEFHFAFRGRMDERYDNSRAVCDKQFLYIRNYMPYVPWMQHHDYLWKMKATVAWENFVKEGKAEDEMQSRYFAPKRFTEELYDMNKDHDNVDNLIENLEYEAVAARMRNALHDWQLQIFDSGLLPESERMKRVAEHNTTIYEMVRNPELYDLPALLNAADLALEENPKNLSRLEALLKSSDCGLRYWGVVGCFLLNDKQAGFGCLNDDSHEVRAMAAWLLICTGEKEKGIACLENLLKTGSYATLTILNMADWMDDNARKRLMPAIQALDLSGNEAIMRNFLQTKLSSGGAVLSKE